VLRAAPGEAPLAFMLRAAQGHDGVWVVAPETDQMLLKCCQLVAPARWLGCDAHSIRQASSKQRTLAALREAGVLTPLDFVHENDVSRWVVKPDDGAGAVDTHVHASLALARQEAQRRRARGETVVLEPWVDGEALSLSLMCRAGQAEVLSVNTQHLHVRDGGQVVFDGVTRLTPSPPSPEAHADPRTAPFAQLARRVAGALPGLHGFVGVDLVWHPRLGAVLVEVNPRITCAYVGLSAHLGRNLAADVLANREALHAPA
jgi:predicted ATP-grasp superfamily ATP-dependent carboligase